MWKIRNVSNLAPSGCNIKNDCDAAVTARCLNYLNDFSFKISSYDQNKVKFW